jgi:hypothetical protein
VAATNRLRYNGLLAGTVPPTLAADISSSGTAITFHQPLKYQGTTPVPTIADPDYLPLVINPDTAAMEIVWLTAYTAGATSGTVLRAQESTTGVAHTSGADIAHGPTVTDIGGGTTIPYRYGLGSSNSDGLPTFGPFSDSLDASIDLPDVGGNYDGGMAGLDPNLSWDDTTKSVVVGASGLYWIIIEIDVDSYGSSTSLTIDLDGPTGDSINWAASIDLPDGTPDGRASHPGWGWQAPGALPSAPIIYLRAGTEVLSAGTHLRLWALSEDALNISWAEIAVIRVG